MGKYICQRPIHPGELLKEETEERKLSQRRLAEQMGISYKVLNDILNCRRPITTQTAMLFEAALGISASLLMRMQLDNHIPVITKLLWQFQHCIKPEGLRITRIAPKRRRPQ